MALGRGNERFSDAELAYLRDQLYVVAEVLTGEGMEGCR